ncbi:MAG: helicase C-terminal domain-containing protein, partial [Pseudolactococcus laudensis]
VLANPEDFVWIQNHVLKSSPTDFLNFAAMIPQQTKTYLIGATLSMSDKKAVFPELLGFTDYTFDTMPQEKNDNQQVFVATDSADITSLSPEAYANFIAERVQTFAKLGKPMVVLFTSNDSLALTAQALEAAGVDFLQADASGDASRIKKKFDERARAILLGSKKFWEGVDFERQDELILLVTRLPFTVPDDILIRKYAKRFKNPFYDFSVPLATLQLKQAIGRVNRRKDQKSVVVILDKRLAGKTYAKKMVKNLRQASRVDFAKIEDILQETKDFL